MSISHDIFLETEALKSIIILILVVVIKCHPEEKFMLIYTPILKYENTFYYNLFFINPLIHLFNKYLLHIHNMPGTIVVSGLSQ